MSVARSRPLRPQRAGRSNRDGLELVQAAWASNGPRAGTHGDAEGLKLQVLEDVLADSLTSFPGRWR